LFPSMGHKEDGIGATLNPTILHNKIPLNTIIQEVYENDKTPSSPYKVPQLIKPLKHQEDAWGGSVDLPRGWEQNTKRELPFYTCVRG
jgi:hypothetical protein